jgi:hypothetical protein
MFSSIPSASVLFLFSSVFQARFLVLSFIAFFVTGFGFSVLYRPRGIPYALQAPSSAHHALPVSGQSSAVRVSLFLFRGVSCALCENPRAPNRAVAGSWGWPWACVCVCVLGGGCEEEVWPGSFQKKK